jgi:phytanoyl-CoA hydroxylase
MHSAIDTSVTTSIRGDGNALKLRSSRGIIEPHFLGKLQPTSTDTPMEEIRRRYEQDGYVWLKRLLPPFDVWNGSQRIF